MAQPQPQPEWNAFYQRYLITLWNAQHERSYWQHHIQDQGWVFFDWVPMEQDIARIQHKAKIQAQHQAQLQAQYQAQLQAQHQAQLQARWQSHGRRDSVQGAMASGGGPAGYRLDGRGRMVAATYNPSNPQSSSDFEELDPSFYVKPPSFFEEGKVFSVLFTQPAGANAVLALNPMADYNTNLSRVKHNQYVHTQVRNFIVVKHKREFCFAVPIFTYHGKATTKNGVVADEHAIAYSWGRQPELVEGELPLNKEPICIVMEEDNEPLRPASRIYLAIHHPIQYNVRVKNLGYVHPKYLALLLGYWNQENSDSNQDAEVAQNPNNTDSF